MSEHWIKTAEPYFGDVESGIKSFEVRIDDRLPAYAVGDTLHLQQFVDGGLTGRECACIVTYALRDPRYVKEGYVVLGIKQPARKLTLEDLREMNGQLVWVVEITNEPIDGDYWGIVNVKYNCAKKYGVGAVISSATDGVSLFAHTPFSDYNKTWTAYDHKPEE